MKRALISILQDPFVWLLFALGAATAFFRIEGHGLWGDEIWQVLWARQQGVLETIARFRAPPDFPLHFILVQLTTTFGTNPFWVRLPSALSGTMTVPLVYLVGKRALNRTTGIVAAVLLSVSPFHVWFAQDARPYAALAFYSLLSFFFFVELARKPTWYAWLGLTLATTLNLYNQFFSLMPILSQGVALFLRDALELSGARGNFFEFARARARTWFAFVSAIGAACVLTIPLLPGYVSYIFARGPGEVEAPPFRITADFLIELYGMFGGGTGWSLALFVVLCALGILASARRRNFFALLGIVWLGLPLLILALAQPRHIFIPRYFLFMQPIYFLFIGYGIFSSSAWFANLLQTRTPMPRVSWNAFGKFFLGAVAIVALIPPTWQSYWVERINDWGTMCEYLHRNADEADAVAGDGYIIGLMMFCYPEPKTTPIIDGNRVPLESLKNRGLNVWFLHMDGKTDATWLEKNFTPVPRPVWGKGDLRVTASSGDFKFLQAEHVARLWYYETPNVPSHIVLNDFPPDEESAHGFAEISDYTRYALRLSLPPTRPRILRLRVQERSGGALQVSIDGKGIGRFKPKDDSRAWRDVEFVIPENVGEKFLVELFNAPKTGARVQEIEVRYAQ